MVVVIAVVVVAAVTDTVISLISFWTVTNYKLFKVTISTITKT